MNVRLITSNSLGTYYVVDDAKPVSVRVSGKTAVCLTCRVNACKHTDAALAVAASARLGSA